jgi:hypothetical protein
LADNNAAPTSPAGRGGANERRKREEREEARRLGLGGDLYTSVVVLG